MLLYAMSRGAVQGGRELRLRVRHKKPKRLLRSWYNLIGQEQAAPNGVDTLDEIHKDLKHQSNNSHAPKDAVLPKDVKHKLSSLDMKEQVVNENKHRGSSHELKEPGPRGQTKALLLQNVRGKSQTPAFAATAVATRRRHKSSHIDRSAATVQDDEKRGHNSHEIKEPYDSALGSSPDTVAPVKVRLNGNIFHNGSPERIANGKCHTPRSDAGAKMAVESSCEDESEPDEDRDLVCSVCSEGESDPPNEIVICDTCNKGFHQACHTPKISDQVLLPNIPWHCRNCVPVGSVRKSAKNYKNGTRVQMFKLGFPYNMKSLQWDPQHKLNTRNCYCYCGGPGQWNMKMLQCKLCRQWFHEACIQGLETPLLYGDSFYYFACSVCNNGPEVVKRMQLTWMDITHLTLYNLVMERNKKYYDLDDEILPYLNSIWLALQLPSDVFRCSVHERRTNIYQCLCGDSSRFKSGKEVKKRTSLWGLRNRIAPPIPGEVVAPREHKNVVPVLLPKVPPAKPTSGARVFKRDAVKNTTTQRNRENGQRKIRRKKLPHARLKGNSSQPCKLSNGLRRSKAPVQNGKSVRDAFSSDEDAGSSDKGESGTFLDAFIPPLADMEGINNPFRDEVLFPPPPAALPRARPGRPPKKRKLLPAAPLQHVPAKLKLRGSQRRLLLTDTDSEDSSSVNSSCTATSSSTATTTSSSSDTSAWGQLGHAESVDSGEPPGGAKSGFSLLARRISADGKVQYLVEWGSPGEQT